jgi:3-isopropylmalate/(R)-2-methylmalate dehydratase large subunit
VQHGDRTRRRHRPDRPDDKVYEYLHGRRYAPTGAMWDAAVAHWRTLAGRCDAAFDREVSLDAPPSRR